MTTTYPEWAYYPSNRRPETWVFPLLGVVNAARDQIDTSTAASTTSSDRVLAALRPGLLGLGYDVEAGKAQAAKIRRPVLFGSQGSERVAYEVDAVHDELGIVVEIEAGRGAQSNAVYRDLIRASLILDARYLVLGVMSRYRFEGGGRQVEVRSFEAARDLLDAIYASGRLQLPFDGVLLFGY